ncbi:testis-specific gene 13 protein [Heteronotia binoei]|uniref:testis-specific gene 13 protein n=1 Tax=Heteronotia binoei TaxID=13085 RepID=UPI002931EE08|nr:testis-specific gene 13 protein [Heteronotia binoei]
MERGPCQRGVSGGAPPSRPPLGAGGRRGSGWHGAPGRGGAAAAAAFCKRPSAPQRWRSPWPAHGAEVPGRASFAFAFTHSREGSGLAAKGGRPAASTLREPGLRSEGETGAALDSRSGPRPSPQAASTRAWIRRVGARWRAKLATSLAQERSIADDTMSQFRLQHEKDYSPRPDLIRYFMPMTDAEFQERLDRHKGEIAIMMRSSEFNQDKTTLIVTNNPLSLLISGRQLTSPFHFFTQELLGTTTGSPKPYSLPPLKETQQQLVSADLRRPGKPLPYRFATAKDFKSEGKFSKVYAERRLLRMYPQLQTCWLPRLESKRREPLPGIEGWAPRKTEPWEPLTLTCLAATKPTLRAPGHDGFRYGKAPLWVVKRSVAK